MAKENKVRIKGIVPASPIVIRRDEVDDVYGRTSLMIGRSDRKVEDGIKQFVTYRPYIISKDPELVDQIESLKELDIVDVYGVITTRMLPKTSYCMECSEKNVEDGVLTYITPISIEVCGHVKDKNEGVQYLNKIRKTTNQIDMDGMLTRDPKIVKVKSGLTICQYQLAVTRTYEIKGDDKDITTDYLWVKSYGKNAEEDRKRLVKGSIIGIDGFFQTRDVKRKRICSHCGQLYEWTDRATEIVPYKTEYYRHFRSDEEVEQMKKDELDAAFRDIFGDIVTDDDIRAGIGTFEE